MIYIIEVANNSIQFAKKQGHLFGTKSGKHVPSNITKVANNSMQSMKKQRRLFGVKSSKCTPLVNINLFPYSSHSPS